MTESCPVCDRPAVLGRENRELIVEKRTVSVPHEFYRCTGCAEELFEPEQMDAVLRCAADAIRAQDGTLAPAEIAALRRTLGYTQAELETIMNTGAKTITRWERGTVAPTGPADTLLRVFLRHPEMAHELAEERGIRRGASRRKAG